MKLKYNNKLKSTYDDKLTKTEIYGFMHVAAINDYQEIVLNQINKMIKSGLYNDTQKISMGVIGYTGDKNKIFNFELPEKISIDYVSSDFKEYEYPTLNLLKTKAEKLEKESLMWYIHTKGVFNKLEGAVSWREELERNIILRYKNRIKEIIQLNLNASGAKIKVKSIFGYSEKEKMLGYKKFVGRNYFAGNFWWTKSSYVKKLPEINSLDRNNRYYAETWIGLKYHERFNSLLNYPTEILN